LTVFDPRDERVLRAAEGRLEQDRAAELARGAALARELPGALDPASDEATSRLGRLLAQVEGLTPEGRGAFLAAARPSGGRPCRRPGRRAGTSRIATRRTAWRAKRSEPWSAG
jgi:hypothetical protein